MQDAINQFNDAMRQRGIIAPASPVADGKIHRCEVENGRKGNKDGAYKLFLDATPAGGFQNHKDDLGWQNWRYEGEVKTLTPEERAARRHQIESAKAEREARQLAEYEAAAKQAQQYWQSLPENGASHYLKRKKVSPYGVRFDGETVIVPVCDISGKLWSVQTIQPDGRKSFLKGGKVAGNFHRIGSFENASVIVIAEGYATAASIHQATGYPVAVAFNAGNLSSVAKRVASTFPDAALIIAGDDDRWTNGNPGKVKAREAAKVHRCAVVMPVFSGSIKKGKPTDFNDLHCLQGLEEVKRQIEAVQLRASYLLATAPVSCSISNSPQ